MISSRIATAVFTHTCYATLIYLVIAQSLLAAQNPTSPSPPPPGFRWIHFAEIEGWFLSPNDWVASFSKGKLMGSLVITPPAGSDLAGSSTRMTVNVVPNLTQTNYQLVSDQISRYRSALASQKNVEVRQTAQIGHNICTSHCVGVYVGELIVIDRATSNGATMNEHRHYLANDQRDWLVIVNFHNDSRFTDKIAPTRETLLSNFRLQ